VKDPPSVSVIVLEAESVVLRFFFERPGLEGRSPKPSEAD
jgi:hypothetical protein